MHISEIDTPAILLNLDKVERNIQRAQEYLSLIGTDFRPHMKTHKLPPLGHIQREAGAVGLTCAKIGEAEVMADAGLTDLQICYPIVGEAKLQRLMALARRATVRVCFDSLEVAQGISRAASAAGLILPVLVEVDTGMRRCGVPIGPAYIALCEQVARLPGIEFAGVMSYQGFIRGADEEKIAGLREEDHRLADLVEQLRRVGLEARVVSGGSTPTLFQTEYTPTVTEQRAGTYIFNDRNTVGWDSVGWDDCAMRIACTVVSRAVPGQMIIDGGAKTFTSDQCASFPGFGRIVEDPDLLFEKMNEEHGYVKLDHATRDWKIGDRAHVIPNHVCVAMNMQDEAWVHRGDEVVDRWPIAARGKLR